MLAQHLSTDYSKYMVCYTRHGHPEIPPETTLSKQKDAREMPSGKSYLLPRMRLNLRKFELCVIRVHFPDLFTCRCAQDFDDFY